MSIMRALKNVGIGYLQGSTDIMAQKAKEKQKLKDLKMKGHLKKKCKKIEFCKLN